MPIQLKENTMRRLFKRFALWLLILALVGVVYATPNQQQVENITSFTSAIRADLELAANDALGQGVRPPDWTANIDRTDPNYITDLWFDKELLANAVLGDGTRPPAWLSITAERAEIVARNTRYDLELLADNIYGGQDLRPPVWSGADALYRCPRNVQNLNALMSDFYSFSPDVSLDDFGFCTLLQDELQAAVLETNGLDLTGQALDDAILATRGDLERLANEVYGVNSRPLGWAGNTDPDSPLLLPDTYEDLRIIADETLGSGVRPPEWIGRQTESSVETWRNLRYDTELLADAIIPTFPSIEGERPRGWQGTDPLRTCSPSVQDVVIVLESQFADDEETPFNRELFVGEMPYCATIEAEANLFAERRPPTETERQTLFAENTFTYESDYAFTYLDTTALEYMGVMPRGTRFRAWYRNFNESTMMFVSGQDFAVYIDRRWTDMPQDVFDRLPTLEGIAPVTFCDAPWCDGPGPTPTPTGGALEALLAVRTPVIEPTVDPQTQLSTEDKTLVNFEHVEITYLNDNLQTQRAQVALRLCEEPQRITCEEVTNVYDNAADAPIPVISQQNGRNVYEFSYGYTSNLIIESATLRSNDIFVSDPTLPRN